MTDDKLAEIRKLAVRLQTAAYDHGSVDASDHWSDQKYADADDRSRSALTTLMDAVSDTLQAHAAEAAQPMTPRELTARVARGEKWEPAAEAAQAQAQSGEWVMVPKEPTQTMLDANGDCEGFPEGKAWLEEYARVTWANMLAAAPQPQAAEPVAWLEVPQGDQADTYYPGYRFHGRQQLPAGIYDLYAHPQPAQDAKDAAHQKPVGDC